MGFFSWLLCFILVVALVLLLFPFSVRIDFEAGERSARALFFFFKKKIYEYEKKWGKEGVSDEQRAVSESAAKAPETTTEKKAMDTIEAVPLQGDKNECHPERNVVKSKDLECLDERRKTKDDSDGDVVADAKAPAASREELKTVPAESKIDDAKKDTPKVVASKPVEVKSSEATKPESEKKEKPKKEKPKLTDREFWTILLTPDLDARAFKYALKIIAAVFSLFRIRFNDCFVEGIRTDYVTMGYIAAVNGVMKAYPYVGAWDLRMDWLHEKELRAAGNVRLSITLLRIICFVLETLVLAGILAFIFWRRRSHVLKTKELPELGFIRRKIVDFILED